MGTKPIFRWLPIAIAALTGIMLAACSTTPRYINDTDHARAQAQRVANASLSLQVLSEPEILIRLNNGDLETVIENSLNTGPDNSSDWAIRNVDVTFQSQYISLDAEASIMNDREEPVRLALKGDVGILYQSGRLLWQPRFHRALEYGEPAPGSLSERPEADISKRAQLEQDLLGIVNRQIQAHLLNTETNVIGLDPMPLGILETGARAESPLNLIVNESIDLDGVFTTAGVAVLVEPEITSLLLDLNFVPRISSCEGLVNVSRSHFTRAIKNREPVNLTPLVAPAEDVNVFFSEISDTREPGTIIHYWFADGQPASVAKLDVQPSARWRTWSSRPTDWPEARYWEVIVVEQSSGCILASMATITESNERLDIADDPLGASQAFEIYAADFSERAKNFPAFTEEPGVMAIDVSRTFFNSVLGDALFDLRIRSGAGTGDASPIAFEAGLAAMPLGEVQCSGRQCETPRACVLNYENCPVERDTRNCSSCLIRNPLNNRCLSEAEDPICVAARDATNVRMQTERNACVEAETARRDACERSQQQELAACQRRAQTELGTCEAQATAMEQAFGANRQLAVIEGQMQPRGPVEFQFSGFRIDGDLERLHMDLALSTRMELSGDLSLKSPNAPGPLMPCFADFSGQFSAALALPYWHSGLSTELVNANNTLEANWSGFTQRFDMQPTPLQSFLSLNPDVLDACELGLTSRQIANSVFGSESMALRGQLEIAIQPLVTRITLLPAYLTYGNRTYTGEARLKKDYLSYRMPKP